MSVFGSGVITRLTTDLFGFGATIDGSGAITAITGATLEYVTAAPAAVRNGGSLALRSNGSLYATAGAGVWVLIGGAGAGWNLPDDVAGTWGTTSPKQVSSIYVSGSNRFDIVGAGQTGATAVTNPDFRIATGANTITGAVAGSPSGFIQIFSGATDCTNAGGTGGATGAVSFSSGNATSTLGVSGSTGNVSLVSGNSDDANSGSIVLTTGTAAGTRGVLDINIATIDTQTQATQWLALDNTAAAFQIGSTGALNALSYDSTNAAEEWTLNVGVGLRAVNDIPIRIATAANDRFTLSYVSGSNLGALLGTAITAGGAAQATRPFQLSTGARTLNDAAGSPASGALTLTTGANTVSFALGGAEGGASGNVVLGSGDTNVSLGANTGGGTGTLDLFSGNAGAALGTSGASGAVLLHSGSSIHSSSGNVAISSGNVTGGVQNSGVISLTTGNSAGGNTGSVTATTGDAAGAGGGITSGSQVFTTGTVGGTGTTGSISLSTGNTAGAGTSGSINLTPGTTVGGTRGTVNATGLRTLTNTALGITAATTLVPADSGGTFSVTPAGGGTYAITVPSPATAGLSFRFFMLASVAQTVTITAGGGTFLGTLNDANVLAAVSGTTITFEASGGIGDYVWLWSDGTRYWLQAACVTNNKINVA